MTDVSAALVTALTSVATSATDAIGDMVPIAAPILGAFLVIRIGIAAFKKIGHP